MNENTADKRALPFDASRGGGRFALVFVVLYTAMYVAWTGARGTPVERIVIDVATVQPSVVIINTFTPREHVQAQGHQLVSPHARLSVLHGCEGIECALLLVAAVLAFGAAPWPHRLSGMLIGVALVYLINQVRIVALFYSFRYERGWFEILHGFLAPTLIVAIAGLFFLCWASRATPAGTCRESIVTP